MNKDLIHYIYYSYEENGRGYIGSRTCQCNPQEDVYFGSYKDKTFQPTAKIILATCKTKEERYQLEYFYQKMHNVVENPHFANRAFQTQSGFSRLGLLNSPESRRKMSESRRNRPSGMKGKKHSEETKSKIANSLRGVPCPQRATTWTEERRRAHSKNLTGKKGVQHTQETINKIREKLSIPVAIKNIKTEEVKEFSSQKEAAKYLNVRQGVISDLYRKKRKLIKNWGLSDKNKNFVLKNLDAKTNFKKVKILNVETGKIVALKSVTEAAQVLKVCASSISKIMRGRKLRGYVLAPETALQDS